ncbi:family 10 glycosylhydrolase [Splendidivirga corallicola]
MLFVSCEQRSAEITEIRGIYGHPKPLWDKDFNLQDLGINAIFVHSGSINHDMVNRARSEGLMVFAEFATLNGKNYVETHPEAWAINEKGEKVQAASWFMGVCPTEPGFRQYRFDQLRDLLLAYDLDGVWMDYVHWHAQFEEPEPILPETCFCDHCLDTFSKDSGIEIPEGITSKKALWILNNHDTSWRKWRSEVIYDWTYEMKSIIKKIKPEVLLGLYHCPWNDEEFNNARYRILGLDYDLLKETIDVFSPMVYHERMGREPNWVKENIQWFSNRLNIKKDAYPKVWPIVQAYNNPGIISNEEFEIVLKGGLAGGSSGVMMFTTSAVAEDEGKTEVMKKVYTKLMEKSAN